MDGFKHKVAVLPVADLPSSAFAGREYLGLYPYIDKRTIMGRGESLYVCYDNGTSTPLEQWLG
jgi:hypothetical protein